MEYAIVQIAGKQYTVKEGQEILVDRLPAAVSAYTITDVLLLRKNGTVYVGNPFVSDAQIRVRYLAEVKGKKMRISKFKAKVRYDKTIGFRPIYSRLKIESLSIGNSDMSIPSKKAAVKKKTVV